MSETPVEQFFGEIRKYPGMWDCLELKAVGAIREELFLLLALSCTLCVAYVTYRKDASTGKEMRSILVDGQQGKEYDIGVWFPVFSPDSKHVAYAVSEYGGKKSFVVVGGIEGRVYDLVSTPVFESPNRLRYNAKKGDSLYLVEETIK